MTSLYRQYNINRPTVSAIFLLPVTAPVSRVSTLTDACDANVDVVEFQRQNVTADTNVRSCEGALISLISFHLI